VARSLYTGITTESFMTRLREGETPAKSITIVNCECDDARVRTQESVKGIPASDASRQESVKVVGLLKLGHRVIRSRGSS
jgi:hypothetical protein